MSDDHNSHRPVSGDAPLTARDADRRAGIRLERLHPDVELPRRATPHAAGYDLRAYLNGTKCEIRWGGEPVLRGPDSDPDVRGGTPFIELLPGARARIPLGFRSQLPDDVEAQIRPRSGTSFRTGLAIPNAPGTVDADYRGEWMVLVRNVDSTPLRIFHGDAIAQAVFARVLHLAIEEGAVDETARGAGGFGSTDGPARRGGERTGS